MASLIEKFKEMHRRGLIAKRACSREHCGQGIILQVAQPFLDQLRVPLVFSSVMGDVVFYRNPGCQEVGEFVIESLKDQGFPIRSSFLMGR